MWLGRMPKIPRLDQGKDCRSVGHGMEDVGTRGHGTIGEVLKWTGGAGDGIHTRGKVERHGGQRTS